MSKCWAVVERFEVPHFDRDDEMYLTRWRIIATPFGSLYLHRIGTPDSRPTLHDHPWSFTSIVLRGGYTEVRLDKHTMQVRLRVLGGLRRRVNVMRRDDAHFILSLRDDRPCWTLLLVGARRRTWGYLRKSHGGRAGLRSWIWTPFDVDVHADEFDEAMRRRSVS